jgi:hypothetical protein
MKQEMLWALAVLEDPVANLEEYKLTQDEMDELFQECHMELAEILTPLAQVLSKKVNLKVEDKTIKMSGPVPPGLNRIVETVEVKARHEPRGKPESEPERKPKSVAQAKRGGRVEFVGPDGPTPKRRSSSRSQFGGGSHLKDK